MTGDKIADLVFVISETSWQAETAAGKARCYKCLK